MKEWNVRARTCVLLAVIVLLEGGCWGRSFFRMPAETLDTSARVDSLLRENAMLRERISAIERTLRDDHEFARSANAERKMDLEELKDQLNALQEMLREEQESSPFKPTERRRTAPVDTTGARSPSPAEATGATGSFPSKPLGGDTLAAASGGLVGDSLSAVEAAADTSGGLVAPTPPPEQLYRQIYLDFNRREYQLALEEAESFLLEYPDDPLAEEVLFIRGQSLMEQTAYIDALKEFSTLLQRYPRGKRAPGALLRMAISYEAMEQNELAAGVVRRLLKDHPRSDEAKAAEERFAAILKE